MKRYAKETNESDGEDPEEVKKKLSYVIEKIGPQDSKPCSLFYPDRWTKEAKLKLPRFNYFPFGGGIRGCVGKPFA
jgi:hypothetical protein